MHATSIYHFANIIGNYCYYPNLMGVLSIYFQVWPKGPVVFPDFFHNETDGVWKTLIKEHIHNISFDGLWIVRSRLMIQFVTYVFALKGY